MNNLGYKVLNDKQCQGRVMQQIGSNPKPDIRLIDMQTYIKHNLSIDTIYDPKQWDENA